MDKIVDHLFVFKGDAVVEDFPGNYSDFRAYEGGISNAFAKAEKEQAQLENKQKFNESMDAAAAETKSWKEQQHTGTLSYNEQKEHTKLERDIAKLEREKEEKQKVFLNPDLTQDQITEESLKLQKIIDAIALKEERWFELSSKMEG